MKMNVIRYLILPWFLFFSVTVAAIVGLGVELKLDATHHPYYVTFVGIGIGLCLFSNFRTLTKAGIWLAHSLPSSLRYNSWPWIARALTVAFIGLCFYLVGQLSWIPLVWQAFVIPAVFTAALFIGIWSLMGPILTWSSKIPLSRALAFILSLPVFALVPITATFLGETILASYIASRPEMVILAQAKTNSSNPAQSDKAAATQATPDSEVLDEKAKYFKDIAESGQPCPEESKEIQGAVKSDGPEETVYWAIKAIKCSEMRSVVGLPILAKIMVDHKSPKVRAAAIRAMPKFGQENVKQISYLLVKRISEKEEPEVIEAAASVLSRLGEDEYKFATNRLKSLLNSDKASGVGANVLGEVLKRHDLVAEYVAENLPLDAEARTRAISMICALPKTQRPIAEPYIPQIVASIKTGGEEDPAIQALDCLGQPGFQAIRKEVMEPATLDRPVAARAFAEMSVKSAPEALETAETCARDKNDEVRKWCSQSLGKIGAPALPKIIDLLQSRDSELKDAGKNALNHFEDKNAKDELERIRANNSGWMANKKKLQIAEAVSTALIRLENEAQSLQNTDSSKE